ncbi:hypothetical protein FB45DRAFT_1015447 [Roridomyces roridus]|uniref:Uncharacterized protein n=1 Tax=Roridomyces roridus TaxID=1738132 RepID=A0AAD7AWY5_9AGAR|nr:hypothetical protein FB45DRAFT_1015447 [Roridomyces roridus]
MVPLREILSRRDADWSRAFVSQLLVLRLPRTVKICTKTEQRTEKRGSAPRGYITSDRIQYEPRRSVDTMAAGGASGRGSGWGVELLPSSTLEHAEARDRRLRGVFRRPGGAGGKALHFQHFRLCDGTLRTLAGTMPGFICSQELGEDRILNSLRTPSRNVRVRTPAYYPQSHCPYLNQKGTFPRLPMHLLLGAIACAWQSESGAAAGDNEHGESMEDQIPCKSLGAKKASLKRDSDGNTPTARPDGRAGPFSESGEGKGTCGKMREDSRWYSTG